MELAIISIIVLSLAVWIFNRIFGTSICSVCGGVGATWIWLIVVKMLDYSIDPTIPAMLMGGSVVGISYQLEKRIVNRKRLIYWKIIFISLGFLIAYNLLTASWISLAIYSAIALSFGFVALGSKHQKDTNQIKSIEDSMKNCC
ncbi:MAG: hypothetical protein A2655_04450 [Candidatus Yanofskybacteria bacterium RIFCSPHIGHO2_01_FULL_43_42]|uniref:Uncharacterized protein n=1 Tax=Candidatus Yanofskybacteria bacterium RIFCSPLOWO2_01_FULL_43_22 TaxID=1802695 RepID=A0A1F8GDB7_9BACT|nr:MAG: hypothetical protein A2655_04450 [Candidatus Yanofskybacteria bacterium RIFCSPHIGHO2_01_FULL_43_42]OGN13507.1 MAG: hypothetical protein A3D48_02010 [Candidatus Yanofskybacteria bacterium RIFCSPHIGHO2_02_FULL_43_17]OGN23362.1 MAG: hypothetical protein A3A13_04575 [Candidatus Yanofskybacteria bacterium RIFCSPLOWO2_01_FULL_43_22]